MCPVPPFTTSAPPITLSPLSPSSLHLHRTAQHAPSRHRLETMAGWRALRGAVEVKVGANPRPRPSLRLRPRPRPRPCPLRPWFGRPKLRVDMLCKYGGFTIDDLSAHYVGSGTLASLTHVIPLCATFPMGFSWSSFVAQSYLLERCAAAGLEPRFFFPMIQLLRRTCNNCTALLQMT